MSFAVTGAIVSGAIGLGGAAIGLGGAALSGAGALGAGAVSTIATVGTSLAGTAIGAGGAVLGGIGSLGTSIYQTGAGIVSGAGTALFGGGAVTPGLTIGEQMAAMAEPGFYDTATGGLFSNLSWDTIGNVAQLGYGMFTSAEDRKLVEKAIAAQRGAGYVVSAPGAPSTAFAPSIMIPTAAQAASKELDKKIMIKYAIYALIAYLLFKGFM